jgi:hypothetical protein
LCCCSRTHCGRVCRCRCRCCCCCHCCVRMKGGLCCFCASLQLLRLLLLLLCLLLLLDALLLAAVVQEHFSGLCTFSEFWFGYL